MSTTFLTVYLLIWPLLVAGVFGVIVRAFLREVREARDSGNPMI